MFKNLMRKMMGIKDFLTQEIAYQEYNDSTQSYDPVYKNGHYDVIIKQPSYIFINESEKIIKIFIDDEMDRFLKEIGSGLQNKRIYEMDAFMHPTEILRIVHKGDVEGNTAYIVESKNRNDDRIIIQGEQIIHAYEYDPTINQHRKIRSFIGARNVY